MIILILLFISFSAYAVMWTLQFHFTESVFKNLNGNYWNPAISWTNKWNVSKSFKEAVENPNSGKGERFPGSSTFFVWLTDAFHLFQFIFLNSLFLALSFMADGKSFSGITLVWWEAYIVIRLVYALVFEGLFGWLLIKK